MEKKTTVLIVDDYLAIRKGLRAMLTSDADNIEVVGEAGTGEEAIRMVQELGPHVVLMDIQMPGIGGIEATREIRKARPATRVVMVTIYDSETYVVEAILAGAAGYLTKDVSPGLLCHSVRIVADGGTLVPSELLRQAIMGLHRSRNELGNHPIPSIAGRLTAREMEVLRLLAQGCGNKAIGAQLCLAEVTVKKHVQSLFGKLGVSDRTNAAIAGVRMGLAP